MARIEHTVEVNVPLQVVYNQWTQFEDFPRFMEGVREVKQLDDVHLHWRADRSGHEVEWDSEITDQIPDQHIAWRDLSGPGNTGVVNFYPVDEGKTRVQLVMESHPNVAPSEAANAELITNQRIEQDLARFKRLLEAEGHESGAWRGEIHFSQPAISGDLAHDQAPASGTQARAQSTTEGGVTQDRDEKGQSVFAQQVSTTPGIGPQRARSEAGGLQFQVSEEAPPSTHAGDAPRGQQTRGDTDPRTASLDGSSGTTGVDTGGEGGTRGASDTHQAYASQSGDSARRAGSSTSSGSSDAQEEMSRQGDASGRQGSQTWIPNILQGWDDPMAVMRKMGEEMDQLFERFIGRPMANRSGQGGETGKWMPAIEIRQHENHLHVYAELPGVKKEDVHIEILHDKLTIEGQRQEHHYQAAQGYKRSERSYGRFYRMVPLPQGVDPESVKATMQEGVLEIRVPLPVASQQKGRRIDIQPPDAAQPSQGQNT